MAEPGVVTLTAGGPPEVGEEELPVEDEPELPVVGEEEPPVEDEPELPVVGEEEPPVEDEPELPEVGEEELPVEDEPELPVVGCDPPVEVAVVSKQFTATEVLSSATLATTVVVPLTMQVTAPGDCTFATLEPAVQDAEPPSSEVVPLLYFPVNTRLLEPPKLRLIGVGVIARLISVADETVVLLPHPQITARKEKRPMAETETLRGRIPPYFGEMLSNFDVLRFWADKALLGFSMTKSGRWKLLMCLGGRTQASLAYASHTGLTGVVG